MLLMNTMRMSSSPMAMPSGMTLVAASSRMRMEATTAPTARANGHHARQGRGLRGVVAQGHSGPGQHDELEVAARAPEQGGGGQRNLPQLVAPQAAVAGPEVGQQGQLRWPARCAKGRCAGGAFPRPVCGMRVLNQAATMYTRISAAMADSAAVSTPVSIRGMSMLSSSTDRCCPHQLPAQQHAQDDGGNRQPLDPAVGLDQLRRGQQLGQDAVLGG